MNFERGFRRLFIILSVAVLGASFALDAGTLWSHARIYATFDDGRTGIFDSWNLADSPPYEMVKHLVWESLKEAQPGDPLYESLKVVAPGDPLNGALRLDPVIKTFRVVRGPAAWSWGDFFFTRIAGSAVVLLWAGFFAVRWIARGFTSQAAP